jgi:sugar lactone lactonase YvrE
MSGKAEIHARGLGFPEGPVALGDGSIAFVDLLHQKVRRFRNGKLSEICALQGSPNGMRLGPDGALYVANNGGLAPISLEKIEALQPQITGRIQRISAEGTVSDLAVKLPGDGPWRPNDLVFTPRGDIVFTDPQNWEVLEDWSPEDPNSPYKGGRLLLTTREGRVSQLAAMTGFPNGLVFHPDGSLLVGLTLEHRILRFPWKGAAVGEPETWCRLDDKFAPDGMIIEGNRLYAAGSVGDRVAVIDLEGKVRDHIDTGPGSDPTNLCVAHGRLWVTLGLPGQLVSFPL